MSLMGWAVGLSIADKLLGDDGEREEESRREPSPLRYAVPGNAALRRRNDENERRIAKLEDELCELKRGGRRWRNSDVCLQGCKSTA